MALRGALLAFVLIAYAQFALGWRRIGLGHAIWAHPTHSHLILLSKTATLSSVDLSTGGIQWRLPSPSFASSVVPLAALYHQDHIFLLLSNEHVRAVRANGDVLWELPGCGIAHPPQENVLPIKECNSRTYEYASFMGEKIDADDTQPQPVPTLNPRPASLTWSTDDIIVTSQPDGLLRAMQKDKVLWEREEGLSHPRQGAIYISGTISILVLLSELGVLFGLRAEDGTLAWKIKTEGVCSLYPGHATVTIVACSLNESRTTAMAVDTISGTVLQRDSAEQFMAIKGALQGTSRPIPYLRLLSKDGKERELLTNETSESEGLLNRPWLMPPQDGSFLAAVQNGSSMWKVSIPSSSKIVAIATSQQLHPMSSRVRPPAVRVTGDRRLLHKYTDPNTALVLAYDERASETHALLIDTYTGAVHDIVTHPGTALPASAVKGESWFVYSLWSTLSMQQELHVLDMFHQARNESWVLKTINSAILKSLGPNVMSAFQRVTGTKPEQCPIHETTPHLSQCSAETVPDYSGPHRIPYVVRSSTLLTQRILSLDLTQTIMGFTEPAVIIALESGQVTLASKFLLDARRPKETNSAYRDEYLREYRPITFLQSHSRDSLFIDQGNHVPGLKTIAIAPHHTQESICQVAVLGTDTVYSLEHPAGNFDSLPDDFSYVRVIAMLLMLIVAYIYTRGLNVKASLAKSWS